MAYTYTDARDRLSAYHDLHEFIFGDFALDGPLSHTNLRTSLYSTPHNITGYGAFDLPFRLRFALSYKGLSGVAFTYRIRGDANADGVEAFGERLDNDPVYVPTDADDVSLSDPTQWRSLDYFIRSQQCLRSQRGHLLRRNSCREPWYSVVNVRLSKLVAHRTGALPRAHRRPVQRA